MDESPDASCRSRTCADAAAECGDLDDGCGGTLACGRCPVSESCGGGGEANRCGGSTLVDETCSVDGWCHDPLGRQREPMHFAGGSGPDDVWFGTPSDVAYRWNGTAFETYRTGLGASLASVWSFGPRDALGTAGTRLVRWDGARWAVVDDLGEQLGRLFVVDRDRMWVMGREGLLAYDGAAWSRVPGTRGDDWFWASGRDDLWVANREIVRRWNGASWVPLPPLPEKPRMPGTRRWNLDGLAGRSANEVVVAADDHVLRWDGAAWSIDETAPYVAWQDPIVAGLRDEVFVRTRDALWRWDGTGWREDRSFPQGQWWPGATPGAESVWAVGGGEQGNAVQRWTGTRWDVVQPAAPQFGSLVVRAPGDVWLSERRGTAWVLHRHDGTTWREELLPEGVEAEQFIARDGRVWAWSTHGVSAWDGTGWQQLLRVEDPDSYWSDRWIPSVLARAPDDVWMFVRYKYDDEPAQDWLHHFNGHAWTEHPSPVGDETFPVFDADDETVWLGVQRWNPRTGAVGPEDRFGDLSALRWARLVGTTASPWLLTRQLSRWDGAAWLPTGHDVRLQSPAIEAPDSVWFASARATVLRWDGVRLVEEALPTAVPVSRVAAAGGERWAITESGGLLRRR